MSAGGHCMGRTLLSAALDFGQLPHCSPPFVILSAVRRSAKRIGVRSRRTPRTLRRDSGRLKAFPPTHQTSKLRRPLFRARIAANAPAMEKNRLYYGDNLAVLREYIKDESVDLIYLDPPFNSRQDYNVLFAERKPALSEVERAPAPPRRSRPSSSKVCGRRDLQESAQGG